MPDLTPKQAADALDLSERTVRRRLAIYRQVCAGRKVSARLKALAIPYRLRLGVPYRIPAEVVDELRSVEAIA